MPALTIFLRKILLREYNFLIYQTTNLLNPVDKYVENLVDKCVEKNVDKVSFVVLWKKTKL